jgi:DNA-binding SARP family transcriptional activator/tetratricopeptide (TPR) repeat protein
MEFRLLGPVEVDSGDGPLSLGGAKPRSLLAALLLEPGRVVSTDRLIDVIWDEDPPDSARALIQTYVSALRRAARGQLAGVIVTRAPGYLAQIPAGSLDRQRFEALVEHGRAEAAAGRHRAAADALGAATALWRGPALGGVAGRLLAAEAARLDETRIVAVEERIAAELRVGRCVELVGELAVLVGQHPTRERLRGQLMLALYGAGRTADALAAYQQARSALVDELGVEPGPELIRLHRAILRGDAALLPPPAARQPVPAQLPPDPVDFTGRVAEVGHLVATLTASGAGTTICVLAGPGGAGKTALAVRAAHRVAEAYPDGQLVADLGGMSGAPAAPIEVLGRFLRALGDDPATVPDGLAERAGRYRTLLADRRVLVLLDDAASEAQVRPLLPGAAGCAVLVTSRNRLPALAGADLTEVGLLSPDEATTLLGRIAGEQRIRAAPEAAAQIVARCGRLPLAVRIAGARLAVRRHWTPELLADRLADEHRRLDELRVGDQGIRASVELSYRTLDPPARATLRRLGALGLPDFPSWVPAALLDVPAATAERLVEQLVDAHLVDYSYVDGAGQVRYRLHDLVRIFASEQAGKDPEAGDAAATARVVGGWLWLVQRLADRLPAGTIQHRPRVPAARCVDPGFAGPALTNPRAWLAAEQQALVRTVERAAELGLAGLAVELASALCDSVYPVHNLLDAWSRTHDTALRAARRAGDVHGEAVLLAGLGELRFEQDRFAEAREYLARALGMFRVVGDARGEAATLTALGWACREQGHLRQAWYFLAQAGRACAALGDDTAIAHCARVAGSVQLERGDFAAARAELDAALAGYRRVDSRRGEALTLRTVALLYRAEGKLDAAEHTARAALDLAGDIGDEMLLAYCLRTLAKTRLRQGHLDEPLTQLRTALDISRAARDRWGTGVTLRVIGELHLAAGRYPAADRYLVDALAIWDELAAHLFRARTLRDLAQLREAQGEPAAAKAALDEALETFHAHGAREYAELTVAPGWRKPVAAAPTLGQ